MKLDQTVLAPLRELGGEQLVHKLLRTFVDHAPTRRRALEAATADRDLAGLEHVVHSLRSASAMLGATELSSLAGRLESLAEDGAMEALLAGLPELEAQLEQLVAEIERQLAGSSPGE